MASPPSHDLPGPVDDSSPLLCPQEWFLPPVPSATAAMGLHLRPGKI